MSKFKIFRYSDEDGVKTIVISASWCKNRAGICLQFAIPLEVMDVESIVEFSTAFMEAIQKSYGNLLRNDFYSITESPIVCSASGGDLILLWSFQGVDDKATRDALKENNVKQIKYD